mgnify:CR=1 FL=1
MRLIPRSLFSRMVLILLGVLFFIEWKLTLVVIATEIGRAHV